MDTSKPVEVKIIPADLDKGMVGRLVFVGLMSLAPVVIAILMQKPALRQAIVMRTTHYSGEFCSRQGEFWNGMAAKSKQAYNAARL